jgi:hypothetical protein
VITSIEFSRAVSRARGDSTAVVADEYTILGLLASLAEVPVKDDVRAAASSLPPIELRTLDAIHLASALALGGPSAAAAAAGPRAMAELGSGRYKVGAVANAMGSTATAVSTVRQKLLDRGLIYATEDYGYVDFTAPRLDEFMHRHMPCTPASAIHEVTQSTQFVTRPVLPSAHVGSVTANRRDAPRDTKAGRQWIAGLHRSTASMDAAWCSPTRRDSPPTR